MGRVADPVMPVLRLRSAMVTANPFPRVTEAGAVPLPANLSISEANRLARGLRPSWMEIFAPSASVPPNEDYAAPALRDSVGSPAPSRRAVNQGGDSTEVVDGDTRGRFQAASAARSSSDVRSSRPPAGRERASVRLTADEENNEPMLVTNTSGLGLKLGGGLVVLAILGGAVWFFTRPSNDRGSMARVAGAEPTTANTAAATTSTASQPKPAAEPKAEKPLPPEAPQPAEIAPVEVATALAPTPPPPVAEPVATPKVRADAPVPAKPPPPRFVPPPAPVPEAAPSPKKRPPQGNSGIVRDAPF